MNETTIAWKIALVPVPSALLKCTAPNTTELYDQQADRGQTRLSTEETGSGASAVDLSLTPKAVNADHAVRAGGSVGS